MNYQLEAQVVSDTMWARFRKGDSRIFVHDLPHDSSRKLLGTSPAGQVSLFLLNIHPQSGQGSLTTAWGESHQITVGDRLDPLWESAAGICEHMDTDHADTYPKFLRMNDCSELVEAPFMPWVQQRGFFVQGLVEREQKCFWISFPALCPTPNHVRKTLIQMLRGDRDE